MVLCVALLVTRVVPQLARTVYSRKLAAFSIQQIVVGGDYFACGLYSVDYEIHLQHTSPRHFCGMAGKTPSVLSITL
jgi:hypothetical protein